MLSRPSALLAASLLAVWTCPVPAAEPVTLKNLVPPSANRADEPLAKKLSLESAVRFLDSASLEWQKTRKCFACHTNSAYLYTRPAFGKDDPAHKEVRAFAEQLVRERWKDQGPRWDAEVVATASALAFNDAATTRKLHPLTREALDRMWTVQRKDGGWTWLKCNWPPMESDDHYGVTLAALAVGVAPDDYAKTEAAKKGLDDIRRYLKANPPTVIHHRAMLLWVSSYLDGFLSEAKKKAIIRELFALQKSDGGWNLATLGQWMREDDRDQDTQTSDGYATGFVIYVLRRAGIPADDGRIQKGVVWLKANQRESGRWFTRSLNRDNKHFISHAGTAFALMALAECGEIRGASR
jgi:squalene-hopene/tetraprenyl-beta-curcumene cyclase